MEEIKIDEQMKERILKFIKNSKSRFSEDQYNIKSLKEQGVVTKRFLCKVFQLVLELTDEARNKYKVDDESELKSDEIELLLKFDKIYKPLKQDQNHTLFVQARHNMDIDEIFNDIDIALKWQETVEKAFDIRYMRDVAQKAIISIDGIEKYKINLDESSKEDLRRVQIELKEMLGQPKTNTQGMQEKINIYNKYARQIWNEYLTSPSEKGGEEFRWVIHNFTKSGFRFKGEFDGKYMSTSLMTNNIMGRYGGGNFGLIIKPKNIITANYEDTYTNNDAKDEENLFNFKEPILLPQEIEEKNIEQTVAANGEMLNYDTANIYSELVLDDFEIIGVYIIDNGEHTLAENYEYAKRIADERGIPLIEVDIGKEREKKGLEPMTVESQKSFCYNLLNKCCEGDAELENSKMKFGDRFVDENFQKLYEMYKQLKKDKPDITEKDILKIFSEVTMLDFHFAKIAKKIDEKYLTLEEKESRLNKYAEKEYGLNGIKSESDLKDRLEQLIGEIREIKWNVEKKNPNPYYEYRMNMLKKFIPDVDEFLNKYLDIKDLMKQEDKLYSGLDFNKVSYAELEKRMKNIILAVKQQNVQQENVKEQLSDSNEVLVKDSEEKVISTDNLSQEAKKINVEKEDSEELAENISIESKNIDDENGEKNEQVDDKTPETQQLQSVNSRNSMWMNRFKDWYDYVERAPQKLKVKLIEMRKNIINKIKEKINGKETKSKQQNNEER